MSPQVLEELTRLADALAPALLVFARVVGLFVSAPIIGGEYAPPRVKALAAVAVTAVLAPLHLDATAGIAHGLAYLVTLARELAVGLTIGFLLNVFFLAAHFGGDLMGRTAGYAAAEVFVPGEANMRGPIGELMSITIVLLFLITDGHHFFIAGLQQSFAVVPIGGFTMGPGLMAAVNESADLLFEIGVTLAFPVIAVIMAVAMAEGVIARTIPQINILHITFAIKIAIFLVVLYAGLPAVIAFLGMVLALAQEFVLSALPTMAP